MPIPPQNTASHDTAPEMGVRRFGRVNLIGLRTLATRETMRFLSVWQQTVLAPLMTAGLFVVVFALALGRDRGLVMGVPYLAFLGPGILMMTVIQNAFANTSSSIVAAKMQGNIIDTLMPPLSPAEVVTGYLAGALARAGLVALVILAGLVLVLGQVPAHPGWVAVFVVMAALLMGGLGMLAGIVAQKFDQMAVVTNFIVTPLSFLSGTFYSVEALPPVFRALSHANPIFYLIDGARFGVAGVSDASPWLGLAVSGAAVVLVVGLAWHWMRTGYRMKP
ncbi:ABC transporter permease [Paracoccus jiaweipingae]|uniref:ABC transporter permease n=1 Tax=unclassified Paracoccus (in: a-proteobacteria) TaxID=2688777 RepID=UPI003791A36D